VLAERLGRTVGELSAVLTVPELRDWMAFDRLGQQAQDSTPTLETMRRAFSPRRAK